MSTCLDFRRSTCESLNAQRGKLTYVVFAARRSARGKLPTAALVSSVNAAEHVIPLACDVRVRGYHVRRGTLI